MLTLIKKNCWKQIIQNINHYVIWSYDIWFFYVDFSTLSSLSYTVLIFRGYFFAGLKEKEWVLWSSFFLWKKSVDSLFNMFNKWNALHDKERSATYFVFIFQVWSME